MIDAMADHEPFYRTSRPYTRWWWFSNEIKKDDIKYQLDWLKKNNFGGVEIAWVYPQPGMPRGPKWLSKEWSNLVAYAKSYCDEIGLGCDFTFGTLWPFGGTMIGPAEASKTFDGVSTARLDRSWEEPEQGLILDHLDQCALEKYSETMAAALAPALQGSRSAFFCDSWEVPAEKLWTGGFDIKFLESYGYDLKPYLPEIDQHPEVRYDYRKLLSAYVLNEFYRPFTAISHRYHSFTRVQCHGAPTDLLAAYAAADVPESEAILFDPDFARIPASAAALNSKTIVSAEAFTCLYGWNPYPGPGPYQNQERLGDLKLLADALIANGVNLIFWHGMPFNPAGGKNEFYATVHVGPNSSFAEELPAFNRYLAGVCAIMQRGKNRSDLAVYLPLEDMWMRNELPEGDKKPSARYYWEMHTLKPPDNLRQFHPLWVSGASLTDSVYEDGCWRCGKTRFRALFIDSEWLETDSLSQVLRLARQGLPVLLKRRPIQPGRTKSPSFDRDLEALLALKNVIHGDPQMDFLKPLVAGDDLPDFWYRQDGSDHYFFFSHPRARGLTYPMVHGQHLAAGREAREVRINIDGRGYDVKLEFQSGSSRIIRCHGAAVEIIELGI
jgi:hypothetical protein